MTKYTKLTFLLLITLFLTACGGSDITPPDGGDDDNKPKPPTGIAQMEGVSLGVARMSVSTGNVKDEVEEVADIMVFEHQTDKNKLEFVFRKPEIALGKTDALSFVLKDDKYSFALNNYKTTTTVLEGSKIPAYIKNSFPSIVINKVVLGSFTCKDGATYNTKTETFAMKFSSTLAIYFDGGDAPLTGHQLDVEYINLKKKD